MVGISGNKLQEMKSSIENEEAWKRQPDQTSILKQLSLQKKKYDSDGYDMFPP